MAQEYYIGIDIGTGSARACVSDQSGTILALADEAIKTWQPKPEYYEQSTQNIWRAACNCVKSAISKAGISPQSVRGLAFDATCSLAVIHKSDDLPVCVTPGPNIGSLGNPNSTSVDTDTPNVVLWLDHRPVKETAKINATGHEVLRYVGGGMSVEMEIPKILWLKNHMAPEKFAECCFYDLPDVLTHLATGGVSSPAASTPTGSHGTRSFCSTVCKQGYLPLGVSDVTGWQPDFFHKIGLSEIADAKFAPLGGNNTENGTFLTAGHFAGTLSPTAAEQMGLHTGVVVGSGVIDAYAGWIGTAGASVVDPGNAPDEERGSLHTTQTSVSDTSSSLAVCPSPETMLTRLAAVAGTSTCHLVMSYDGVFVPGVWGPNRDVLFPGRWIAEGGQSATGEMLRTLIDCHVAGPEARKLASEAKVSVYQFLNTRLCDMVSELVDSNEKFSSENPVPLGPLLSLVSHMFLYPDFFGNRSPFADPRMRGIMAGLGSDQSSIDSLALRYLTGMEAIALQTKAIIIRMNESGHKVQSIFMSGSLGLNEILNRLMATACQMPVLLPAYPAAAVVQGAAMLGARAAATESLGVTSEIGTADDLAMKDYLNAEKPGSLFGIMEKMSKPATVVWPSKVKPVVALLETKFSIFEDMAKVQTDWRTRVDDTLAKFE